MPKKQMTGGKPTGGNLEVEIESVGGQGKRVTGIGADVSAPRTGNQKVKMKMGVLTADEDLLIVGAVVHDATEDES